MSSTPIGLIPTVHEVGFKNSALEKFSGYLFLFPLRMEFTDEVLDKDRMKSYEDLFKNRGPLIPTIRVWAHNAECDNFSAGGYEMLKKSHFPEHLPIDYFFGKKEGDVVEIISEKKGKHFSLTCKQLGSRYGTASFENMLEDMFMVAYNNLEDQYEKGTLNEENQKCWELISAMKREHYPNSTISNVGLGHL